jgi:hypothetical protein
MCFGSYQKLLCQFLFAGDTEELNRRWYEANTGQVLTDVQQEVRHPTLRWMAATLDGRVEATGAVWKRRLPLAGGSFGELLGRAGFPSAIKLRSVLPALDPFLAQRIELSHHPKSDNCEVMIKRVGEPYSRTLHDDEASCVDSGQFVQVGAPEIFPRPLQIA